ncbi:acc operon protein [Halovenus amylolytica]|uniref:acc operon protein n=1 Tax=Halovenus amylolytica TaxID=2500550 RepID=UPI003D6A5F61
MSDTQRTIDGRRLRFPDAVSTAEAAAITAAVEAYSRERTTAADSDDASDTDDWNGNRFAFAGRLEALGGESKRVPQNAPTDRWTAAGRADRYEP